MNNTPMDVHSNYYCMHAQDVKLEDITSSAHNADILRQLREGDLTTHLDIFDAEYFKDEEGRQRENRFIIRGDDHIGWLAYFLMKSRLRSLFINFMTERQIAVLMNGIKGNSSIHRFSMINSECGGDHFADFIIQNRNLREIRLWHLNTNANFASTLASALKQREGKTLTSLSLSNNNFSNDDITEIVLAMSEYKQLQKLYIHGDLIKRDQEYYDILADSISLEDITSCEHNAEILKNLRDSAWDERVELSVVPNHYIDYGDIEGEEDYFVGEDDDWGWFAYFVGRSKQLKRLRFDCPIAGDDNRDAIIAGLNRNKYIEKLLIWDWQIECSSLSPFIISNNSLKILEFWNVDIGLDSARNLALALEQRQHKTLTRLVLSRNNLSNESLECVIESLRGYPRLLSLSFSENPIGIGREMCCSPGLFVSLSALPVKELLLSSTDLDDEDLTAFIATMSQSKTLQILCLSRNQSVTTTGLRALTDLFTSSCPLETLHLDQMNIGDDGAVALADGLTGNTSLKNLVLSPRSAGFTSVGWSAFSTLLCDSSSVNNTYQSNHTLEHIGDDYCYMSSPHNRGKRVGHFVSSGNPSGSIPFEVAKYLNINKQAGSRKEAARIKINQSHPNMRVEPLFEYELKLLPLLLLWYTTGTRSLPGMSIRIILPRSNIIRKKELSTLYKFIRGMPMHVVKNYGVSSGRKRKFDQ